MKQLFIEKNIIFLIREYNLFFWEMSYLILVVIQDGSQSSQILVSCDI